jgi:hypothetical protein
MPDCKFLRLVGFSGERRVAHEAPGAEPSRPPTTSFRAGHDIIRKRMPGKMPAWDSQPRGQPMMLASLLAIVAIAIAVDLVIRIRLLTRR